MSIATFCCFIVKLLGPYAVLLGKPIAPVLLLADYNGNKLSPLQPIPPIIVPEGPIAMFAPLLLARFVGLLGYFGGLHNLFVGYFGLFALCYGFLTCYMLRYVWSPCSVAFCSHAMAVLTFFA